MKKFLRSLHRSKEGFTLIELLVVVSILGALAGVAVPNVGKFINSGNDEAMNTELHNVELAMSLGMLSNGLTSISSSWDCWTNDLSGKPGEFDFADYLTPATTEFYYKWDTDGTIYQDEDGS